MIFISEGQVNHLKHENEQLKQLSEQLQTELVHLREQLDFHLTGRCGNGEGLEVKPPIEQLEHEMSSAALNNQTLLTLNGARVNGDQQLLVQAVNGSNNHSCNGVDSTGIS